jgi:hypothetical protein
MTPPERENTMETKFILKSKTVWGAILMLVPTVFVLLGLDAPSPDELAGAKAAGEQILLLGTELVGFALAIWGRMAAKTKVVVK